MHYSIIPGEIVFEVEEEIPEEMELNFGSGRVILTEAGPLQLKVKQIMSTNPDDYLQHNLKPGSIIDLRK